MVEDGQQRSDADWFTSFVEYVHWVPTSSRCWRLVRLCSFPWLRGGLIGEDVRGAMPAFNLPGPSRFR
jgi:hypothetical protein